MPLLKKIFKTFRNILGRRKKAIPKKKASKRSLRSIRKRHLKKKRIVKTDVKKIAARKLFFLKSSPSPKQKKEILLGEVTHYFSRIGVCVVKMTGGSIRLGDRIRIKGNIRDFIQQVRSLQIENVDVMSVHRGQLVGLKVNQKAREGDRVYKIN